MAYTSTLRISGITSGLDTESLVQQLMNAESLKLKKLQRETIYTSWKQEAYRSVYSDLKSFQQKYLDLSAKNNLRLPSTFSARVTTVKNAAGETSSAVSVGSGAKDGTYSVSVKQLATADLYQSKRFGAEISASEDLDLTAITGNLSFEVSLDGVTKTISLTDIELSGITDNDELVAKINEKLASVFGYEGTDTVTQKVEAELVDGKLSFVANGYHTGFSLSGDGLEAMGIEDGTSTKFSLDKSISDIFGIDITETVSFTINGKTIEVEAASSVNTLIEEVNNAEAGVVLSYDEYNGVFKLESDGTGVVNKIEMSGDFLTDKLGLTLERPATDAVATISDGTNTVTVTRSTNSFEAYGVNWTLNKVTGDDALTVTVARDVDSIVSNITSFVESYNAILDMIYGYTNTTKVKSSTGDYYDPLLDEEMENMTESQINTWETNAKKGILYRDDILTKMARDMRTQLYEPVTMEDGSKLSLYQIGITTGDWDNGGKLVIDEDKLRESIEKYGDDIGTLFTKTSTSSSSTEKMKESGLAVRINNILNNTVSTYGTIPSRAGVADGVTEFDNDLYRKLSSQYDKIESMLTKLADKETYYYTMFAKMETAMASADSQLSSLLSTFS